MSIDISVVIPTFRRPKLLREAIDSVLSQAGVTVEVVVIDDSPERSARDVVEGFSDSRVRYLINPQPTSGRPSIVRNLGWPLTQGAIIHFLDDDDVVPAGHYAAAEAALQKHRDAGVVFGRVEPFGDAPEQQMRGERNFFREAAARTLFCSRLGRRWGFAASMIFGHTLLVCGAALVRRDCVERLGGFDPSIRLGEDVDFFGRAIRRFGAIFIDKVSLKYRIGTPSLMHAPVLDERKIQEHREGVWRMHEKYREEHGLAEFIALKAFSRLVLSPCASLLS